MAEHAVVVGAGITGLLCARVLADFFERVTLLERDLPAASPQPRKGVPQSGHTHVLLKGGEDAITRLFPDLVPDLVAQGAVVYDTGSELLVTSARTTFPLEDLNLPSLAVSRPLLESYLRAKLLALPAVRLRSETRVTGALWERGRLEGLRLCLSRGTNTEVRADLVVDASGMAALSEIWLARAGFPEPEISCVRIDARYATRSFAIPDEASHAWKCLLLQPTPPAHPRGGLLVPVEGGRWMVTLSSRGDDTPPTDLEGFLEFARSLHSPLLFEALRGAEPIGQGRQHHFPASVRRRYERMPRYPDGLLALGDSLCCLNPVYGQGMSVAAQQAVALQAELGARRARGEGLCGLARALLPRCAELIDTPWRLSVLPDPSFPQQAERPAELESFLRELAALHSLAVEDRDVHRRLLEVGQLLRPWTDLFEEKGGVVAF